MIKAILFDLDGTLLPMEADLFGKTYFKELTDYFGQLGYEKAGLLKSIGKGIAAQVRNDSDRTNEEVFWEVMFSIYGDKIRNDLPYFEKFYIEKFDDVKRSCGFTERSKEIIELVKTKGVKIILATNPVFPRIATEKRVAWAGLDKDDFDYITTYENSKRCKPRPVYYEEILEKHSLLPSECLMIGNDTLDDIAAMKIGIKTFILTDCLINNQNIDLSDIPHGSHDDLIDFINSHF